MKVAIIGSRDSNMEDCDALEEIAVELLSLGCHGVSGGAKGPDTALTRAIMRMSTDTGLLGKEFGTVWLPSNYFNGLKPGDLGGACRDASRERTFMNSAAAMAMTLHGGWHNLNDFVKRLHTRNVYQILGEYLEEPVDYVICSAFTTRTGNVKGGTATAVKLAKLYGVPVINIMQPDGFEQVEKLLHKLRNS